MENVSWKTSFGLPNLEVIFKGAIKFQEARSFHRQKFKFDVFFWTT